MKPGEHYLLPFEIDTSQHYLTQFHTVISDYFELLGKPKFELIFYKRHYNPTSKKTLEEIGDEYQQTRERIRQISALCYMGITGLLKGRTLKKPHCTMSEGVRQNLKNSVECYCIEGIIIKQDLIEDAKAKLPEDKLDNIYHLDTVLDGLGYIKGQYKKQEYYKKDKNKTKLNKICAKIRKYLLEKTSAVTVTELASLVGVSESLVKTAVKLIPDIEEPQHEHYRIEEGSLPTYACRAYRLLKEHGKPMHYKEIYEKIPTPQNVTTNKLRWDPRLVSIGKSGMWGLAEWGMNTKSIIDLILDAMKYISRPATYKEIYSMVKMARSTITCALIKRYAIIYCDSFKWIDSDTLALKEWDNVPGHEYYKKRPLVTIGGAPFRKAVIEVIGDETLSARELTERLVPYFPKEKFELLSLRLYKTKILEKVVINDLVRFKKRTNYADFIERKLRKKSGIPDEAIRILTEKGPMFLVDMVGLLEEKGYVRATAYGFLSRDPRFSIVKNGVRLKKTISLGKNA